MTGEDMIEVELPPFTEDMRAAIRECRFKTVNIAHTQALVYDADRARMEATALLSPRTGRPACRSRTDGITKGAVAIRASSSLWPASRDGRVS